MIKKLLVSILVCFVLQAYAEDKSKKLDQLSEEDKQAIELGRKVTVNQKGSKPFNLICYFNLLNKKLEIYSVRERSFLA